MAALLPLSGGGEGRVEGARACSHVSSQAYCPLFVWCAVQLYWPYQLIKLALLKSKFRALKTKENLKKLLKLLLCYLTLFFYAYFGDLCHARAVYFSTITVGLAQK